MATNYSYSLANGVRRDSATRSYFFSHETKPETGVCQIKCTIYDVQFERLTTND